MLYQYSWYRQIRHRKGPAKYVEFDDLSSYTIIVKFDILRKNVESHDFFSENVPEINEILQSSIELSNPFDKYDVAVKKGGKVVAHNCVSNHMKSYNTK